MARRTRGEALLNAYMNRYVNDQASSVNSGQKNISSAATIGRQQISSVPTYLPELTDFSDEIYSSILSNDKKQREAYEAAVKEAQKAAEAAAKAAAKSSSGRSSGGFSKKSSSGSSSESSETSATIPQKTTATKKTVGSQDLALSKTSSYALGTKESNLDKKGPQKKSFQEVAAELDKKQEAAKQEQAKSTRYYAAGNNATTTQSTDVGMGSSYGAYAQARAAKSAEEDRKALYEKKQEESAQNQAEKNTTLANLNSDPSYLEQLSQPGVKLTSNQIDAVNEYLDNTPDNKELYKQYSAGEISFYEYNRQAQARSRLEQKVSLGGLGQDLQAFTAGIYNSVPGLETISDAFSSWADKATNGKYSDSGAGSTVETLEGYEAQNPVAGIAGRFAGNAALYGAANAALEGTAFANAAATAGGKAANALKYIPGVSNLVTDGTGAAIGNIITGQTADLALDTIPSLAGDVYSYANGNPDNLTPGQIAGDTAKNFGVNLAMNVGSEAIPALVSAGRNAVGNAVENARTARSAQEAVDADNARSLVQAYENDMNGYSSSVSPEAVNRDLYEIPSLDANGNVTAGEFSPEVYSVSAENEIPSISTYDLTPAPTPSTRAQELTGRGRQSKYTRQIENIFDRMANGETADTLAAEADKVARSVYRPSDFTQTVDVDPAIKDLRDYVKNTPIKISEKEAGDLLSSSGYKSISAYNKANGTKFSMNNGVDWDTTMQELNGMNVGVSGDTFDDLMKAVDSSKAKPEKNFDEDLYNTYVDYVRDNILAGPENSESFEDWLETNGFDYQNLPDYQQRAYDRWNEGDLDLPQTAKDGMPEYGIGAKKSEFDRSIVHNRDYAGQDAARFGLDDAHAAEVGTSEHQVWTDAEAIQQAVNDVDVYLQQAGGDFDKAMDNAISDLSAKEVWDKGDTKTAQQVRDRLRTQFMQTPEGTAEFYKNAARYESFRDTISSRSSQAGQGLQAFKENAITAETGIRKMQQVSDEIGQKWAESNVKQDEKIRQLSEELDKLRKELDEFLKEQGVKTDPTQEFNDLVSAVKELGKKYNVEISDETAKNIAGKIQAGESTEIYYNKLLNEAAGITDLSLDEMEIIDDLYSKAAELPDSKERYDLEQQALQIMAQHLPAKSWFERFDNFRYLAMLGNTRTHVRNLLGNVAMSAVTKAKDEVAAAYQLALPKSQRTKSLYTPKEMKDAARQYLNEQAYSTIRGGSKYNLAQGLEAARRTYGESLGGRVLQKLSDLNSTALEKEDQFFLESAFVRSLSSNLSAKGFDTSIFSATDEVSQAVLKNAVDQAVQDAKEATFRADNAISRMLGKVSNLGDKKGNLGEKIGYIIGNGLLPFTKTPANILKTSLEYNPVGGVVEAVYRGKTGKGSAAVMDALAKGTVGTGVIGLGWWLADSGLVQGAVDEETGKYDETLGRQNYSLVIPGKGSYTIDWASPAAVPFLIGANLAQEGANLEEILQDPGKFGAQFSDIMMQALDPVSEMSLLSGVEDTLDAVRYSDGSALLGIGADLFKNYAQQFIPTVFGQISRAIDPVRRSTYGGGETRTERDNSYLLRSTLNKIPGLSENAEPYIDQWGRTEDILDGTGNDAAGIASRLAYNMLSPGYYSEENVTPVDSYIQGLYEATGDSGVIPSLAPNYINKDGKQYFTPEQKTTYATTSGQLSYSMLDELQSNPAFTSLSESQQAEIVKDVYDLAKKVGASAAIPELDYSDNDAYSVYQELGQSGAVNYLLGDAATSSALADKKTSTGNENASLNDYERWEAVSSLGLDESGAVNAFLAQTDSDSKARKVYDSAGEGGVTAYLNAYGKADTDSNGTVSETEMLIALAQSGLDAVTLYDTYTAYAPTNNSASEKAQQLDSQYGTSAAADWLEYMANYNYAYQKAKESVAGTDEKVSRQSIATSVLNQLGYDNETKRLFWQMTGSNWAERNNPY